MKLSITLVVRFNSSVSKAFLVPTHITLIFRVGLHSLAVKHYERVLDMAERRTRINADVRPTFFAIETDGDNNFAQDVGFAREAAYNLSLIFVTTGANALAEDLYRRWLTL
jgi:general transcription factor 3C polypeptide 3 (transcription factor C subunit 4)